MTTYRNKHWLFVSRSPKGYFWQIIKNTSPGNGDIAVNEAQGPYVSRAEAKAAAKASPNWVIWPNGIAAKLKVTP